MSLKYIFHKYKIYMMNNMGFNKKGWEAYAKQKTITDIGPKEKLLRKPF